MIDREIPLTGGTLNAVVRVGMTVRRPAAPWTPTFHALLRHISDRGFDLAPEPLGFDDSGREVLSYIPGATVGWSFPWPDPIRDEGLLRQVAKATDRLHRAVFDFRPEAPASWQSATASLGEAELVCHNDLAPYNIIQTHGRLPGIIDWDLAGPGSASSELAFVAWQWVPLHGPLVTRFLGWSQPPDRRRRLRLLLDAYGLRDRTGFMDTVKARITYNREVMIRKAAEGDQAYQNLIQQGHVAGMDEALTFLAENATTLQDELT